MTLNFALNNKIKLLRKIFLMQKSLKRRKKNIKLRKSIFKTRETERKCRKKNLSSTFATNKGYGSKNNFNRFSLNSVRY